MRTRRGRDKEVQGHRGGGTRGQRPKMAFAEISMSLENFAKRYDLPHSAKVKEGYEGEYEMEFSTGEVLMVYRAVYPLTVTLTLDDPPPGKPNRVSISTVNDDVRFRVVPRSKKPRIFRTVRELIAEWPLMVTSLADDPVKRVNFQGRPLYRKNDQLKLLSSRIHQSECSMLLECHLVRTRTSILLSEHDAGEFQELADPQSFTVQELVDLPRATRTLRLDTSLRGGSLSGIPTNYGGTLTMEKPDVRVQVARVLEGDLDDNIVLSDPVLVPIDCGITVAPRDEVYRQDIAFLVYGLKEMVEKSTSQTPFVVRIVEVVESSAVLRINTVHTNDLVIIFSRKSIDKILARSGSRYFLVPVTHRGHFVTSDSNQRIDLVKLAPISFPVKVRYVTKDYVNVVDDLPSDDVISFDALVKDDVSVVAAKIFNENFGNGFHVSLNAELRVQKAKWRGKLHQVPAKMSPYADCSEEISELRYKEMTEALSKSKRGSSSSSSSWPKVSQTSKADASTEYANAGDLSNSAKVIHSSVGGITRPQPPPKNKPPANAVVIPKDGNVRNFTGDQMSGLLREIGATDDVIKAWKEKGVDGKAFGHMTDDVLRRYGLDNSIVRFFRDNSRIS